MHINNTHFFLIALTIGLKLNAMDEKDRSFTVQEPQVIGQENEIEGKVNQKVSEYLKIKRRLKLCHQLSAGELPKGPGELLVEQFSVNAYKQQTKDAEMLKVEILGHWNVLQEKIKR